MKTAIKLVLIDLLIAQIVAPILIMIPCTIYSVSYTHLTLPTTPYV